MKRSITGLVLVSMLALSIAPAGAQRNPQAEAMMAAARQKETVEGDLNGAIKQYEAIVSKYGQDRALAATALVHMGEAYLKLGDSESTKIFERIVRAYADQKDAVSIATAHLNGRTAAAGMVSRQVWSGPGVDTYGTVSPDGHYISFVDWSTDALALHDLRNGANREIERGPTRNDTAEESTISKDGKLIAYSWFSYKDNRYQLHLANMEGDPKPRLLFDNPDVDWIGPYDWSPDNRTIAVEVKRKDRTTQVGLVSTDGSLRVLKSVDWRGTGRIFFSPDGKYLGYDLGKNETFREHDIFVLRADGSEEIIAVQQSGLNFMMGWSADGKWLLFTSNRRGALALWALPFSDGKVAGSPELIRSDIGSAESMGVSKSGSWYYGLSFNPRLDPASSIEIASLDGEYGSSLEVSHILKENTASDTNPSWSPDGTSLAYLSNRGKMGSSNAQNNGNHLRHWVVATRSSETGRVLHEFDIDLSGSLQMRWTSDGYGLLLTGRDAKGRRGLFRVDAQSGGMSVIGFLDLSDNLLNSAAVSADAANVYFRRDIDNKGLSGMYRRSVQSGTESELFQGYKLGRVNLSPNDDYIVTAAMDPATNSMRMVAIPTDGGHPLEIMRAGNGYGNGFLGWSPDGRSAFIREELNGKPVAAWLASLDGVPALKLDWNAEQAGVFPVAMHPNRRKMAYISVPTVSAKEVNEVWMLENFLPIRK